MSGSASPRRDGDQPRHRPTISSGRTGTRVSALPRRRPQRGDDRRRRGDRRRLADPAQPVRRVRIAELEHVELDRRHVEHRRDQVVGERRVAHEPVDDLDLLHQREPEALGDAALDLALDRERVHRLADVLRGRDLDDPHEPELGVDVHDRAVRGEGEGDVRVALAELVERLRGAVVVLARALDPVADRRRAAPTPRAPRCTPPGPRRRSCASGARPRRSPRSRPACPRAARARSRRPAPCARSGPSPSRAPDRPPRPQYEPQLEVHLRPAKAAPAPSSSRRNPRKSPHS